MNQGPTMHTPESPVCRIAQQASLALASGLLRLAEPLPLQALWCLQRVCLIAHRP